MAGGKSTYPSQLFQPMTPVGWPYPDLVYLLFVMRVLNFGKLVVVAAVRLLARAVATMTVGIGGEDVRHHRNRHHLVTDLL